METFSGTGELYKGETIVRRVRYMVTAQREQRRALTMGPTKNTVEGFQVIAAHFEDCDGRGDFFALLDCEVTLHLADGRRWDCVVTDIGGTAANTGRGLYRPEAPHQ